MATGLNNDGVIFKSQRDLLNEIEIETDSPHAKVGSPPRIPSRGLLRMQTFLRAFFNICIIVYGDILRGQWG